MTKLLYALPSQVKAERDAGHPGLARYCDLMELYGKWVIAADRTEVLRMPLQFAPEFPVPALRPFKKSFEELCNERALQVLAHAERLGLTMYILYSGGIDSTCLLVSLLKHATPSQKRNIVVLLSDESIRENPRFYEEHIRGKLRVGSSITFTEYIGENVYLLSAEHADMVLGTEKIGKLMMHFGPESIYKPYDRAMLAELYAQYLGGDLKLADFHMERFERLCKAAPVPIVNNMDFLWWVNFALKWHSCFYYILLFAHPRSVKNITKEYLNDHFISFYNTEGFQLWSMHNPDMRIKDTWKSYKWVPKQVIYEFTKDAQYRDHKTKRGSLLPLIGYNPPFHFITEGVHFRNDLSLDECLQTKNDYLD